jgi:hypothetical protein
MFMSPVVILDYRCIIIIIIIITIIIIIIIIRRVAVAVYGRVCFVLPPVLVACCWEFTNSSGRYGRQQRYVSRVF